MPAVREVWATRNEDGESAERIEGVGVGIEEHVSVRRMLPVIKRPCDAEALPRRGRHGAYETGLDAVGVDVGDSSAGGDAGGIAGAPQW